MDEDNLADMKPVRCNLKDLYPAFLLLALSVVCYWKMFDNYFFLDDTNGVFAGYLLSHDISEIFTYNFGAIYMSPLRRVVVALSYIPNYLISGYDPWSYYLTNLLLHFGNSLLVYLIVKKLSDNKNLALLTAFLFSASLNKADAVMMIAHRTTLMGAFFALLSMFLYIRIMTEGYNRRLFLYTLLAFVAALGSYETGLVLPGIFIGLGLIYKGRDFFKKEFLLVNSSFLLLVIILVWFLGLQPGVAIAETSLVGRIYHIFRNILSLFPSFLIPPFVLQTKEVYHSTTTYFGWIELLSVVLIIVVVIANVKIKDRLIYFGLLFFLIAAVPTATVNWGYYPEFPEHRLRFSIGKYSYLSSVGFYIIATAFLCRFYSILIKNINKTIVKTLSYALILTYLIFNIYWLYEKEKGWEAATIMIKNDITKLNSLQLNLGEYPDIYLGGLISLSSNRGEQLVLHAPHLESLIRVIYDNPNIIVRSIRDYNPMLANKKTILILSSDINKLIAFEIVRDQNNNYITRQIRDKY